MDMVEQGAAAAGERGEHPHVPNAAGGSHGPLAERLFGERKNSMNLAHQNLIDISTVIAMFVVIGMFLLLFEPRYPKKTYLASLIPCMVCGSR